MDNDSQYISKEFNNYLKTMNIKCGYIEKKHMRRMVILNHAIIQLKLII
ncbi:MULTISPECIES: hypothetical protein [Acidiplasma]|nr:MULTISPECIES: hypothetical protein [Acidiplasma]